MIDESLYAALIIRRKDFANLPPKFLRRKFWPLALVAALIIVLSIVQIGTGLQNNSAGDLHHGFQVLELLAVPAILAFLQYLDILITLKIVKFNQLMSKDREESNRQTS